MMGGDYIHVIMIFINNPSQSRNKAKDMLFCLNLSQNTKIIRYGQLKLLFYKRSNISK